MNDLNTLLKETATNIKNRSQINPEKFDPNGRTTDELETIALEHSLSRGLIERFEAKLYWKKEQGHLTVTDFHKAQSYTTSAFTGKLKEHTANAYVDLLRNTFKVFWNVSTRSWNFDGGNQDQEELGTKQVKLISKIAEVNLIPVIKGITYKNEVMTFEKGAFNNLEGRAFNPIDSTNLAKAKGWGGLLEEIEGLSQQEAVNFILAEQEKALSGIAKSIELFREPAEKLYNDLIVHKDKIDVANNLLAKRNGNGTGAKLQDVEKDAFDDLCVAMGLTPNKVCLEEERLYDLEIDLRQFTGLSALYHLAVGSDNQADDNEYYTGNTFLHQQVDYKRDTRTQVGSF